MGTRLATSLGLWAVLAVAASFAWGEPAEQAGPPGEDVMRPTQYGMRASPEWIEPFMEVVIQESAWGHGTELSDESRRRLSETMTRRAMETARADGQQWEEFAEYFFEAGFTSHGFRRFDVATGQEFAKRFLPLAGPLRNFYDSVLHDSREFLTPEEIQDVERWLGRYRRAVEATEQRMQRWARGEVKENTSAFRMSADNDPPISAEETASLERRRRLTRARSQAERDLRWFSPDNWPEFIRTSSVFFGFDDDQKTQAEALRVEYVAEAEEIMTAEWKQQVLSNRMRFYLLDDNPGEPVAPWSHRLEAEFRALIKPADDNGRAFRDAVVALATPEQREAGVAKAAVVAAKHGLTGDDLKLVGGLLSRYGVERETDVPKAE